MATPLDDAHPRRGGAFHPRLIEAARVYIPVWLETEEAQRMLARRFEPYEHSAYCLLFIARKHASPKRVAAAEQYLQNCLEITMRAIDVSIDEVNARVDECQLEPRRKEHLPPLRVEVGVCTSLSRRYLEVIARLDHALWMLHAIARVDLQNRSRWKKRAVYLTRCVRNLAADARREVGTLKPKPISPDPTDQGLEEDGAEASPAELPAGAGLMIRRGPT